MPSHRDRDRSASPTRRHRSRRDRERSDDEDARQSRRDDRKDDYPSTLEEVGAKEISADDYFLKAVEFKLWLKEDKGKYLDELSGESSRKYFKKFVKRWNSLELPRQYYKPQSSTAAPSSSLTGYKWNFASTRSKVERDALTQAREDVDRLTHGGSSGPVGPSAPSRTIGPSLPPSTMFSANHTDRQLALEESAASSSRQRKAERNRGIERAEELVPKSGGREGRIEERRATNAQNREMRDKGGDAGLEVSESVLMGDDGGYQAAIARRDAANARRGDRRAQAQDDRRSAMAERFTGIKSKDAATMEMFQQMAKSRFG